MATPLRNVRVPDELWNAARERAERDGITLTAVVIDALEQYVEAPAPRRRRAPRA